MTNKQKILFYNLLLSMGGLYNIFFIKVISAFRVMLQMTPNPMWSGT